ncbi:MarR family winged helix-turn-helix transcriptional regulator [Demetria terragena]|uniref:MarR family winged helix-turn-helix transcriptional regulator n=1 Tax=Demetria terragena TaxID=63959 RepID=UPI000365E2B0|nr:MarR family transcriptional regulator [Demetria terragena]
MSQSSTDDVADRHLARWSDRFPDPEAREAQVEAALVRSNELVKRSERALRSLLADDPLSYEDFRTLHALLGSNSRGEAVTPAELAERARVTRAGMTSRVDRLVEQGLATRTPDQEDRRRILVTATEAGIAAWTQALDSWEAHEQALFNNLTDRELAQLNAILRKLAPEGS